MHAVMQITSPNTINTIIEMTVIGSVDVLSMVLELVGTDSSRFVDISPVLGTM